MSLELLRWLHVIGATVLLGTGAGSDYGFVAHVIEHASRVFAGK